MSIMVATGRGATSGVLFRDAAAIENLCRVDTLIVDKTGTLTEGRPTFDKVVPAAGFDEVEILRLAASLDQGSEHPLAAAVVAAARERKLTLVKADAFDSTSGIGVSGKVSGHSLALGNASFMRQLSVDVGSSETPAEAARGRGASVVYLSVDGRFAGLLVLSDPVKATTADALDALRKAGLRVVMATGDGLATAHAIGERLGIDEVHGEVKPADKLKLVEALQSQGCIVAMAGDGINDAPALARADVGIAMGTGTDVAMNSAQVTPGQGRSARHCHGDLPVEGHSGQHEAEPDFRLRLQRHRRADCRGCALSIHRLAPVSDGCRGGDEPELRIGDRQCAAPPQVKDPAGLRSSHPFDG